MPTLDQARSWYPHADPVHGFDHVLRVYNMTERLARAEGADLEIVRAAALLHDAPGKQGAEDTGEGNRLEHHHASAEFARRILQEEGWSKERIAAVLHCIRAHRFRDDSEQPRTPEAKVLFDADKLDAIGAIGVARAVAYAARAGQPIYLQPSDAFLERGQKEPGEPHSAYHEHLFKLRVLKDSLYTPSGRAIAEERHRFLEAYFERLGDEIHAKY